MVGIRRGRFQFLPPVNLWREWAKIEVSQGKIPYTLPARRSQYAGMLVSPAKQEVPDASAYDDPEIVWRMQGNPHHVGLIVCSDDPARVEALLACRPPRSRRREGFVVRMAA